MIGALLAISFAVAAVDVGPVVLRSGERLAPEVVEGVDQQGVLLKPSFSGEGVVPDRRIVPWAEVASVGEGPGWGEAEPYREIADAVDRAERRLARGDITGARRLLEPLAQPYFDLRGPTSAQIASALVACRVLRDDRPGAVRAWLEWRGSGLGPARAWIDPTTGLTPSLPPVWSATDAAAAASSLLDGNEAEGGNEIAVELASLYAMAARRAAGETIDTAEGPQTRLRADAGVRLVWEMVRAQADPEPAGRRTARDALRRRLRGQTPDWEAAWVRLGLGASLIGEPDRTEADAGAAELLTVVLEHQDAAPGLSDLAATLAMDYFGATGRPDHARAVRTMDRAAMLGLIPAERTDREADGADEIVPAEDVP